MDTQTSPVTGIKNPVTSNTDFDIYSSMRLLQGYASGKDSKNTDFEAKVAELSQKIRFVFPFITKEENILVLNGKGILYFTKDKDASEISIARLAGTDVEKEPAENIEFKKEMTVFMYFPEKEPSFSKVSALGQIFNKLTSEERELLVAIQPSPIGRFAYFGGTPVLEYSIRLYGKPEEAQKKI